jgi:glycosyltransferase involved in cell wall biosynthesis
MFITWQPVLTDHQAFTYEALSRAAAVPVVAYVVSMEDGERKAQGWTDTQVNSVERRLVPETGFLYYCYKQLHEHRQSVHIFASPFQQPRLILCMLFAAWLGIEFYLISEPYSPNEDGYLADTSKLLGKFKAALRPILYRTYAILLRSHVAGIFTISRLAYKQYKKAGVPPAKLFLFGYFIPKDALDHSYQKSSEPAGDKGLRIIFIGSLIRRKGVDLLLEAEQRLSAQGYRISIDIYGPGNASQLKTNNASIHYRGKIPFGQAQKVIAPYDLLVLPSRYDGWGVVVNEALCAGVPVVCSDTVGTSAVAEAFGAGLHFTSGDSDSLHDVLLRVLKDPLLLNKMSAAAVLAGNLLQPHVAGSYMLNVICEEDNRKACVVSPWYP